MGIRNATNADEPALEREVRRVLVLGELDGGKFDFVPPARSRASVRSMAPAEVHRLWAQLRPWSTAASRARAQRDIDFALRLVPDDPKTLVVRGYWYLANGDPEHAEATLRRAVELAPRSPETLHPLAGFYFMREDQKSPAARDYAAIAPWVERLEGVASAPRQWNFIAWYWAKRHEPARGIEYARRAVREDSGCASCYDTLALLLYQQGSVFDAVQAQRVAVNLSEIRNMGILARLERYEHELRALNREVSPRGTVSNGVAPLGADCEKATALFTPGPTYPPMAVNNNVEGTVHTLFSVREDGSVTDVVAISGPALLAAAAVGAIQTWRFSPAHCDHRAVSSPQEARVPFILTTVQKLP